MRMILKAGPVDHDNCVHCHQHKERGDLSPEKARAILHDGTVHGHPITEQQRKYFGAVASGSAMQKAGVLGFLFGCQSAIAKAHVLGPLAGCLACTPFLKAEVVAPGTRGGRGYRTKTGKWRYGTAPTGGATMGNKKEPTSPARDPKKTYRITTRFGGQAYSQTINAESEEAAYRIYAADPGDFTTPGDEPFDQDDLRIEEERT